MVGGTLVSGGRDIGVWWEGHWLVVRGTLVSVVGGIGECVVGGALVVCTCIREGQ